MKVFVFLFGAAAAGMLGYIMEPSCRLQLTGVSPSSPPGPVAEETATLAAEPAVSFDFDSLQPSQLPASVTLKSPLKVNDPLAGTSMTLDAGSRLTPLRVEAGKLVVRVGESGPVFPVAFSQTDLAEQLAARPAENPLSSANPEPAPAENTASFGSPDATSPETTTPSPAPAGESTNPPVEPPPPAPAPVEPVPAPVDPIPAPSGNNSSTPVIEAMRESLRGGVLKEFTYDQVLDWQEGPAETIDGSSFQTGTATYKAETIFGVRDITAKALVKDGKVVRWVWPISGMEIR